MPRPNLYQSLHTTVITEDGHPFEVQIRTEEMHKMAEEGIAAHWKYKDGPITARDEQRLAWLRQVVEWQREMVGPERVSFHAEDRSLSGRGLHLHAQGQGGHPAARRHADRLRLRHAHRGGRPLRRRQGQRPHRSAALQAALRRHRRNHDPGGPQSQPRLAGHGEDFARAAEDQALAQHPPARARHRNRPQADRKRSAQVSHRAQGHQGCRVAEGGRRIRPVARRTT